MDHEIKRKFLVKAFPDLTGKVKVVYLRYYLFTQNGVDLRIQKKNEDIFELEREAAVTPLTREEQKMSISREEFDRLIKLAVYQIDRDSYEMSSDPRVLLRVYHGQFEGLARAEVEFENEGQARAYTPEAWMGEEITDSPLGRDGRLLKLTPKEFKELLEGS